MEDTNTAFLESLYNSYANRITDWAYRHLGDYEQAKDIAQDTFLIALIKIDDLLASDNPKRWLYKTAKNLIGHAIRNRNIALRKLSKTQPDVLVSELQFGLSELFPSSFLPQERKLITLYYNERRSIKEISDILGISQSACKMRLLRLRNELKCILTSQ